MRKPRQRTGTALPNEEALEAAQSRLVSGARYQTDPGRTVMTPKLRPMPRTAPQDIPAADPADVAAPRADIPAPGSKAPDAPAPMSPTPMSPAPEPVAKRKPGAKSGAASGLVSGTISGAISGADTATERTQWAYAVRTLPAQRAQISDIAHRMGVETGYIETALRKTVRLRLNALRDKADWSPLTDDAVRRAGDANAEGQALFKATLQLTPSEYRKMSAAIHDPLDMIAPYKVISAFAKVAFARELDALNRKTSKG